VNILSVVTTFRPGKTVKVRGAATDPEDRKLPKTALHWAVEYHHAGLVEPVVPAKAIGPKGAFKTLKDPAASPDDFYRVTLTATDSGGLASSASADTHPQAVDITLSASVPGLELRADAASFTAPETMHWVVGTQHTIEAVDDQTVGGQHFVFDRWSKGKGSVLDFTAKKPIALIADYSVM
jgi:hypothetical protein